jgi:hypothetical protein
VIGRLLESVDSFVISRDTAKSLASLEGEIKKAMPDRGGVVVVIKVAREKNKGVWIPRHSYLLSVFVGAAGANEEEAKAKYQKQPALLPGVPESYDVETRYEWKPAPEQNDPPLQPLTALPPISKLRELGTQLQSEMKSAKTLIDSERSRIADEAKGIAAQRARVAKQSSEKAVEESNDKTQTERLRDQENNELREAAAVEKKAAENSEGELRRQTEEISRLQRQLDEFKRTWRCPAGLTLDECERQQDPGRTVHLAERQAYFQRVNDIARQMRAAEARVREQRAASRSRGARTRFETNREIARARKEVLSHEQEAIDEEQEILRERERRLNERRLELVDLQELLDAANSRLTSILPPIPDVLP